MGKKNYNLVVGLIALIVIVAAFAFIGYVVSRPKPRVIQGEAEASEYRISVMIPGHVTDLYAREGQQVHKGDTVAFVDSPQIRLKLAQAESARAAAEAQNSKIQHGARQEQIRSAYQVYQQAVVQEKVLKKSFDRMQTLYDQKIVAAQKYDEVKAGYEAACASTKTARNLYDLALKGARDEDKRTAEALVATADGTVQEINSLMSELYLVSPSDGYVAAVYPKEGELVGIGSPIMTVTDLSDIWFTFNIREDDLHGMSIGDELFLSVPALDGKTVSATVNYMAVRESYATWKATKETDMYDAKTFEVRAVPNHSVEGLRPGMTVLVENR